jgi:hydrogenase maturation factor
MCLGAVATLAEAWGEGPARAGRLDDGRVVSLAFLPGAEPGHRVLLHLGVPVEVLDEEEEPE